VVAEEVAQVVNGDHVDVKVGVPTLILISKDMADEDLVIFREFGKVAVWKESHVNLPFSQLQQCDYLIVDVRLKSARLSLAKEDISKYNVVHYTTWLQKAEDIVSQVPGNVLTSIPDRAVNKEDFDTQLLNPKLVSPSLVKSFLRLLTGCFSR
jgi:hypothetical protein